MRWKSADLDAVITGVRQPLDRLLERNRIVSKRAERKSPTTQGNFHIASPLRLFSPSLIFFTFTQRSPAHASITASRMSWFLSPSSKLGCIGLPDATAASRSAA